MKYPDVLDASLTDTYSSLANAGGGYLLATLGIAFAVWLLILLGTRVVAWARRGSPAATVIGWALLLLSAGMNPQPPPQEQVEQANRQKKIKKHAQSGDPMD